jgi:DNA-binding PadR family transcriptional regulator
MNRNELYRTRKPWLQLDILGCLVLHGELTKGNAEDLLSKRHGDILDSFKKLEKKSYIEKGRLAFGRGRKQFYYRITEKGLLVLLTFEEKPNPIKFWKSLFGYCHHFDSKNRVTYEKVLHLLSLFGKTYFKYSHYNLPSQLDNFQNMRESWINHLGQGSERKKVSTEQKIIEFLGVHPLRATLKEITEEIGESESDTKRILYTYTYNSFNPPSSTESNLIFRSMMNSNIMDRKYNDEFHTSFLLHNLVRVDQTRPQERYELSLFGILLLLNLIRYHDMNKLKFGLFYGDTLSFAKYFDIVAVNYKNRFPLIFGKWKLLREELKLFAAYNFDITLDVRKRLDHSKRDPIRRGGNREIFDGIEDIANSRYEQLYDLAKAGQAISFRYLTGILHEDQSYSKRYRGDYLIRNEIDASNPDPNKLTQVYKLVMGLLLMLSPIEYLVANNQSSEVRQVATKSELLDMMEESFVDEISAMYYFNLFTEKGFGSVAGLAKRYYPSFTSPKQCLNMILRNDAGGALKDWYNKWLTDIAEIHKENHEILKSSI